MNADPVHPANSRDSVASSLTTLSARDMIEALIAGERNPGVLAELACGRMRSKIPDLTLACTDWFGDHHALLARMYLDHIDHLRPARESHSITVPAGTQSGTTRP